LLKFGGGSVKANAEGFEKIDYARVVETAGILSALR
jgi:hypothetical protein